MRLEIESTVAAPPISEKAAATERSEIDLAEAKSALNKGIKAAQDGNRGYARISLMRVTELDPRNESAWLWLASISEYPEELLGFLTHVLDINPENQRAIEWKAATHALLSKTFVQRGMDACQENRNDFAADCFRTALEHDGKNGTAWMWMASLAESNSEKIAMLEKAVAFEPDNTSAVAALADAKKKVLTDRLAQAKSAAISGNNSEANEILDDLLVVNPDSVDAWIMKSHLADDFDEKIRCLESILVIDPENLAAKAGLDSLLSLFGKMDSEAENTAPAYSPVEAVEFVEPVATFSIDEDKVQEIDNAVEEIDLRSIESSVDKRYELAGVYPQEQYAYETIETASEPFASFAEETPESPAVDLEPVTVVNDAISTSTSSPDDHGLVPYADAQEETPVLSYEPTSPDSSNTGEAESSRSLDEEQSSPSGEFVIPMPESQLALAHTKNSHTSEAPPGDTVHVKPESFECPFCHSTNDSQAISCHSCHSVLTLSDLELLLGNHGSDKLILRQAVEQMERMRLAREFNADELTILGLGHMNLRNFHLGYTCLSEAAKLSPNNVVLGGQVNSLLIRLEEIKLQEEAHLKMPKGKSILVVDDSPTVRKLIAGKLEKSGHDVVCANDGVEAMERLQNFVPDLVLLDINMPRMDGYQVCKNIRSNGATKNVPVVMISGKDGFFDKVRGRMAGTTGYITKPFGPETLMKAVEMYLSGEVPIPEPEEV
ncbi:MAG TPA: response regulator [Pyrinomonadaceae bacterium]